MGMFDGMSEQDLRERPWEFEEFQDYFQQEGKKWGNSSPFKAVVSAVKSYSKLRQKEITPESAIKLVNTNDALLKACAEYKRVKENEEKTIKNGLSERARQRIAVMDKLSEYQRNMNLNEVRDMRVVRALAGKTWENAGPFVTTEAVLNGREQIVGANVNQRILLEADGRKGFFTEQGKLTIDKNTYFHQLIEQTKDPDRRTLLSQNQSIFQSMVKNVNEMPRSIPSDSKEIVWQFRYNLKEAIDQMPPDDPKREAAALLNSLSDVSEFFEKAVEKGVGKAEERDFLEEYCREQVQNHPNNSAIQACVRRMQQYKEVLLELPIPEPGKRVSEYQIMKAKECIFDEKRELVKKYKELSAGEEKGKEHAEEARKEREKNEERQNQLNQFMGDSKGLHELCQTAAKATADEVALSKEFYSDTSEWARNKESAAAKDIDLTAHNIATSRIAEMIGLGHLVAHSEKMVVRSGDKTMMGCFMEFARGVDPTSKDPNTIQKLSEVEFSPNPSFTRDMAGLEILDILCAQKDRHAGNLFYQLSEPDERGKRKIIGLQGIDNDLAFGLLEQSESNWKGTHQRWEKDNIFIDKDVADKIRKLDDAALDFALGDLLNGQQMERMKERVHHFQAHLDKHMVELKENEWNLDKFNKDTRLEGLSHRDSQYVKGLKSIENSMNSDIHKFLSIKTIIAEAREKAEKEDAFYQDIGGMFAEPEAEKQTPPPARRKTDAGQLGKLVSQEPMGPKNPAPGKPNLNQQEKKAENPQRTRSSFLKLSGISPAAVQKTPLDVNKTKQPERRREKEKSMG